MSERTEQDGTQQEPEAEQAGANPDASAGASPLGDALAGLVRTVLARGRTEAARLATDGRTRLELRQLRRDRQAMYGKLGREVRALLEAGEVDHPGIRRGVERIADLDRRSAEVEAQVQERGVGGVSPGATTPDEGEDPGEE